MLNVISWEQFIIAVLVIIALYYVVVVILFYRKEIADLVNRKVGIRGDHRKSESTNEGTAHVSSQNVSMMGAAVNERHPTHDFVAEVSSEDLRYAQSEELPDPIDELGEHHQSEDESLVEKISELLEAIKVVVGSVTESTATKQEAAELFIDLLSRYAELKATPYQVSITDHIYSVTRPPFIIDFSREEIEAFWDGQN